jgi:DNA-binding response OmpR family regulator
MQASVLVVEDESLIAMLIEDHLADLGYDVAPAVSTVAEALAALDSRKPDLALLDVNLGGTMSFPVADALRDRGIPFLFLTGYGRAGIPAAYADCLVLQKPFRRKELEAHLAQLLHGVPAGGARIEAGWTDAAVLAQGAPALPDPLPSG